MIMRPVELDADEIRRMRNKGMFWDEIAAELFTSRPAILAWCRRTGFVDRHTRSDIFKRRAAERLQMPFDTFVATMSRKHTNQVAGELAGVSEVTWTRWRQKEHERETKG